MDALLKTDPRPTGLFIPSDYHVLVFHQFLQKRNIPADAFDIIGCNNETLVLSGISPRPATIDIHPERVRQLAVERLLQKLSATKAALIPRRILVQPTLVTPN